MSFPQSLRHGCWTCRLRRKKCDEKYPICNTCAGLHITCHHELNKPEWMDSGVRQEEMAEQLKREVKEAAHLRREERTIHISNGRISRAEVTIGESIVQPQRLPRDPSTSICDLSNIPSNEMEQCPEASTVQLQRGADCTLISKGALKNIAFGRSDTILFMFYLEHLLPFLFPFYRPSLLEGGRAWILEMMISSPVVRQATLCQSSYFFSLAHGLDTHDEAWQTVLTQTTDAFGMLRQALLIINGSDIKEHLHGAVRILASIMQVQRFEIAILSFNNCQSHLNAALALFKQLIQSPGLIESVGLSNFNTVMARLGPSSWILPAEFPSAEQAAFRFSSALLILDDIVASTMLQEQPRLHEYYHSLLCNPNGAEPAIHLEAVVGCQNWALLQIGEIAVLDAWKQQCKRHGNLDVMELVHRATRIKSSLEDNLKRLETNSAGLQQQSSSLLDVFTAEFTRQSETPVSQSSLVTRVWAHAAFIYLFVVVSGWQPANVDVRYHVDRIIELITHKISPPVLLRTMVWPFCVAGCLAEPAHEAHLREMVDMLQPPSVFGTVRKALEIMENVWSNRDAEDLANRDLATCFRSQGDLVLLV